MVAISAGLWKGRMASHFTTGMPPGWTARPVKHSENAAGVPAYSVRDTEGKCWGTFMPDSIIPEAAHKRYLWKRYNETQRATDGYGVIW